MKLFNKRAACAMLLACLLVLGTCLTACGQKDPVKHMQYVEEKAAEEFAENLANILDEYSEVSTSVYELPMSAKLDLDIEISENALSLLEVMASASGTEIDLSWLANIGLVADLYMDTKLVGCEYVLGLGESELIGLDVLVDTETIMVYMGIPELLKKYVAVDFGSVMNDPDMSMSGMLSQFEALTQTPPPFTMAMPEGKTLEKLINKYVGIVLDGLERVERTEGTAVAGGIESSCDVLTVTVTEADAMAIAKNVLTEVRNDKDFKDMLIALTDSYTDYIEAIGMVIEQPRSGEELYEEFCVLIDDTLSDLEAEMTETTEASEDGDLGEVLVIETYVNKKDEIIGRKLSFDGEEIFSYFYVENKGNFGFEMSAEGEQILRGNGTTGKKLNGTFTLIQDGEDTVVLTVKDLDLELLEDGYINGTFDIDAAAFAENYGDDTVSAILENYTIRLECEQGDGKSGRFVLGVLDAEGEYFVKMTVTSTLEKGEAPALPASEDVIMLSPEMDDTESEQKGMEILTSIDVDAIKDRLNDSPIPKEYVELIEQYLAYIDLLVAYQSVPQQ